MKRIFTRAMRALGALASLACPWLAQGQTTHSGTLPVMYINCDTPFTGLDRENNVAGTWWLESNGIPGVQDLGSEAQPLGMQFRGRGNYTWEGFDKKPLRLMFDTPQPMLGMKANDYFGLFAHADDTDGFLRNEMGFELARRLGMKWTPTQKPVELYYNGEYRGLYFCTELVRVEPDRIDIFKQPDNDDTDPTGGWMCEIDNYDKDAHIKFREGNGDEIVLSRKTPLELSKVQEDWLTANMKTIDSYIYATDKSQCKWADYVDLDELAKFYIVNEIMDDYESFHGSCYLYRDRGEQSKWIFGPVWDFGSSFKRGVGNFIWKNSKWSQHWIGEMYKFPAFQDRVKAIWAEYCAKYYDTLPEYVNGFVNNIKDAAAADAARWPKYGNADIAEDAERVIFKLQNKSRWLGMQWGVAPDEIPYEVSQEMYLRGNFNNWETTHPMAKQDNGTYTISLDDISKEFKIADADWADLNYGGDGVTRLEAGKPYKMKSGGDSDNIAILGGIKNASVTFDPDAETVTITGDWYEIQEDPEEDIQVYFRGDINSWGKTHPMVKGADGKWTVVVEGLAQRFKIADADYKKINWGGDNVTLCEVGVPYPLVHKGKNITVAQELEKALVTYDPEAKTVLITEAPADSVDEITDGCDTVCRVFTLQGVEVRPGNLTPGLYITVTESGKVTKQIVR